MQLVLGRMTDNQANQATGFVGSNPAPYSRPAPALLWSGLWFVVVLEAKTVVSVSDLPLL